MLWEEKNLFMDETESKKTAELIVSVFTDFTLPKVDIERNSESDFLKDLVDGSNAVRKILLATSQLVNTSLLPEKSDVLVGNLVRIYKLYDSYILLITEKRAEIAMILLRCLMENIINFEYLIKHINTDIFTKYKKASLAREKDLRELVVKDLARGVPQEVGSLSKRILGIIEETFKRNEIFDEEKFDKEWGIDKRHLTTKGKAEDIGFDRIYEFIFKNTSGNIHGDWHDIDFNHLKRERNEYGQRNPNGRFIIPSPQMFSVSILLMESVKKYWELLGCFDFNPRIDGIIDWFKNMNRAHEEFLQKQLVNNINKK